MLDLFEKCRTVCHSESPEESISLIRDMPFGTSNAENQKLSPKQQRETLQEK